MSSKNHHLVPQLIPRHHWQLISTEKSCLSNHLLLGLNNLVEKSPLRLKSNNHQATAQIRLLSCCQPIQTLIAMRMWSRH